MAASTARDWKCNVCNCTMDKTSKQSHLAGKLHAKKMKASQFSAESGTGKVAPEQPQYALLHFMEHLQIKMLPTV
jgi:hypothetical protein